MTIGKEAQETVHKFGQRWTEQVTNFAYLGSMVSEDGEREHDIKERAVLSAVGYWGNWVEFGNQGMFQ